MSGKSHIWILTIPSNYTVVTELLEVSKSYNMVVGNDFLILFVD